MKITEILNEAEPEKKLTKAQLLKLERPTKEQIDLLAAILAVSNYGLEDSIEVKDGIAHIQMFGRTEKIDLTKPEKYAQEAKSLMGCAVNGTSDNSNYDEIQDLMKKEHKAWVTDVGRMKWETIKKNWKDFAPITAAMIKAGRENEE
jgi:hypothetical protein